MGKTSIERVRYELARSNEVLIVYSAPGLAVDQLQHADHLPGVIGHGEDEHRARQIRVGQVERGIDRVLRAGRKVVRVVDDQRLTGERDVAGQAAASDG